MNTKSESPLVRVVLIEDEKQIRRFVRMALEAEHCQVHEASGARLGLVEVGTRKPDLVILDLGLPDGDGIDVVRDIRSWSSVPILILSARALEQDRVDALDAGADDYLTKPFGVAELTARARALLRRARQPASENEVHSRFGAVEIDAGRRLVMRDGQPVHLTPIEYRLLMLLVANTGRVLTHRYLLREVWGPSHGTDTHYLRVYMAALRRKLESDATRPRHLITEAGIGYRFVSDEP